MAADPLIINPITIMVAGAPVSATNPLPVSGGGGSGLATLGANTFTATQTITPAANTSAITISGYSLTGASTQPVIGITGTLNTSGNPDVFSIDLTNTASGATSNLMALGTGGLKQFKVAMNGTVTAPNVPGAAVTWATKPASPVTGVPYFISDVGVKGSHWYFDGTLWQPVGGAVLLASMNTAVTGLTNVEVVTFSYQMPAALLQLKNRLRTVVTLSKSGTTDTGGLRVRLGTAGTTADTAIVTTTTMAASAQHAGVIMEHRVESATSVQILARNDLGYGGTNTGAQSAPVTVANISNSLFWDVGALSSSTNNTVGITDVQLWLIGTGA